MEEYRIERIKRDILKDLIYLFNTTGQRNNSIDFFQKKFDTKYLQLDYIGYIAYHILTNEPAAFYCVFPVLINHNGSVILAAQSGDTITNPNHQRKGLFIVLADKTYKLANDNGVKLIFGFPNEKSQHGLFNKLNWERDCDFVSYKFKYQVIPFKRILAKLRLEKVYEIYKRSVLGLLALSPQKYLSNSYSGTIHKSNEYYEYKKYGKSNLISLFGLIIWLKTDYDILIGDISFPPQMKSQKTPMILFILSLILGIKNITVITEKNSDVAMKLDQIAESNFCLYTGSLILDKSININMHYTFSDSDTF